MQITSVHYSRLVNDGNYENHKIAGWAQVEEGETPDEALTKIEAWVIAQIDDERGVEDRLKQLGNKLNTARWQMERMQREYQDCRALWQKGRAFLTSLGLEVPRTYLDPAQNPFEETPEISQATEEDEEDGPPIF